MNTDIKNEVSAAGNKTQYDARAKRLLGNKYILAYILKETIPEFKKRKIDTILPCIEDDIRIASLPVEPGETNRKRGKERGLPGIIRKIRFRMREPSIMISFSMPDCRGRKDRMGYGLKSS